MPLGSYYHLLGLSSSSVGRVEIKKAYLRKSLEVHPDKNPTDPVNAERLFKEVKHAYDVLSDFHKKREYDQQNDPFSSPFAFFFDPTDPRSASSTRSRPPSRPPPPSSTSKPKDETPRSKEFEDFLRQLRTERDEIKKEENVGRRVQLAGLPHSVTEADVRFALKSTEGIEKITLFPGKHLAIVLFLSHTVANTVLTTFPEITIHGRRIRLAWLRDNGILKRKRGTDGSFVASTSSADEDDKAEGRDEEIYFWY